VVDTGIATEENIGRLKEKGYHYVVVNRGKAPFEEEYEGMEVIREEEGKGIRLEVKRYEHEGEVYVLYRSERKVAKERSMRTRTEQLFVGRLEYHRKGLRLPKRTKKYGKVVELVGRLKGKYPKASKLYRVEVIPEGGKAAEDPSLVAVDIVWKEKAGLYKRRRVGKEAMCSGRIEWI